MTVRPLAFASIVFGSLITLGCATPLELKPDDGSSVTLDFVQTENALNAYGFVSVYVDDYDCYGFSKAGGTPVAKMPDTKTVSVTGRKFMTISSSYHGLSGFNGTSSCYTIYTFPVDAGARYRVAVGNDGAVCRTRVSRLSSGSDASGTPVQLVSRSRVTPVVDSQGPWCTGVTEFAGSSSLAVPHGKQ